MKSFRKQFLECQKENWAFKEKCVCCGYELLMCTIFGGQCFSKKCLLMRKEIITVMKIITHDNQEYLCRTIEERKIFIDNYRRLEGERLQKQFPDKMSLIDRIEIIEMTENEYWSIQVDGNAVNYFEKVE